MTQRDPFGTDENKADMKDIEMFPRRGEKQQIAIAHLRSDPPDHPLGEEAEADVPGRTPGNNGERFPARDRHRTSREIGDHALTGIGPNPLHHVMMAITPGDATIPIADPPKPSEEISGRPGQR
jgi:hypothetical protein